MGSGRARQPQIKEPLLHHLLCLCWDYEIYYLAAVIALISSSDSSDFWVGLWLCFICNTSCYQPYREGLSHPSHPVKVTEEIPGLQELIWKGNLFYSPFNNICIGSLLWLNIFPLAKMTLQSQKYNSVAAADWIPLLPRRASQFTQL